MGKISRSIAGIMALALSLSPVPVHAHMGTGMPAKSVSVHTAVSTEFTLTNQQTNENAEMLKLVNELRSQYGLYPLKFNPQIAEEAARWSKYMGESGDYRHVTFEEEDQNLSVLTVQREENVAWSGRTEVLGMFEQWKNSRPHRLSMLSPAATAVGFGFYYTKPSDPEYPARKLYGTTVFYKPLAENLAHTYPSVAQYTATDGKQLPINDFSKLAVIPPAPTYNSATQEISIPSKAPGVRYVVGDARVTLGLGQKRRINVSQDIFAIPMAGYRLPPYSRAQWSFSVPASHIPGKESFAPLAPSVTGNVGDKVQSLFIPFNNNYVDFYLNGTKIEWGSHSVPTGGALSLEAKIRPEEADYFYIPEHSSKWTLYPGRAGVIAKSVEFNDEGSKFTIPFVANVDYFVNGVKTSAGVYETHLGQRYRIEVKPASADYMIHNLDSFTLDYERPEPQLPPAKTLPLKCDPAKRTYELPAVTGIEYKVDGVPRAPGVHSYPRLGTVHISADPKAGYQLIGTSDWSCDFSYTYVATQAPTVDANKRTYTIPSVKGLIYTINSRVIPPGTYPGTGPLTIEASYDSGYILTGTRSWTHTFKALPPVPLITVKTVAPSSTKATGSYTIPKATGISYKVDGVTKTAGTYASGWKSIKITAVPAATNYTLTGTTAWTIDLRKTTVKTVAPKFNSTKKTVVIPKVTGLRYDINGSRRSPGTHTILTKGTIKVTSRASVANYAMSGVNTWSTVLTKINVKPAAPRFNTAKNTVAIPRTTGVVYYVNGAKKNAGTFVYKNNSTVKVTTKVLNGSYALTGTKAWSKKI